MALPVVAIVGRPNVGKSSLLNSLAGRMISIVEPTAGVTRDRISALIELDGRYFELVDTGGYGIEDHDNLTKHVEQQISLAIDRCDLVLFMVDAREGVVTLDKEVAGLLRARGAELPVLLVANKADSPKHENLVGEFFQLGFGEPICVSAMHGRNRTELVERVLEELADHDTEAPSEVVMKLAVVGRRNAGKSTFINALAGEERVIVSEVAGTTRDAVDVRFERDGRTFIAIDTAGLRKKGKMSQESIEFYSYTRATRSVRRADVVLMFLDATAEISQVDKKLARYISDQYKPCIIVVNKWDLAKDRATTDAYVEYIEQLLPGLSFAPISFITANQSKNVQSLLDLTTEMFKQATTHVSTGKINRALEAITKERAPSARRKIGLPKIYYGTQVSIAPPSLLLFVNNPSAFDDNYQRFLINRLRETLPFSEVPIRVMLRNRREQNEDEKGD
ncbi:MAG: ribosome biogenesis GTPase Der [Sedimentisphaerales bacterium]|nr:ribosome biogenesis GTPase Der [Sedimentisphaerales bacterium]